MIRFAPTLLVGLSLLGFIPALPAVTVTPTPDFIDEDGARFERLAQTTFRWKSVIKVYDIAFHVGVGRKATEALADIPMRLELRYHRGFTAAEIVKGGDGLLRRNVEPAALARLAGRLEQLNIAYVNVKPGDVYALTYVPGRGTSLRYNGKVLASIPGHDFAAAYFSIWLGDEPICQDLRDKLLGL